VKPWFAALLISGLGGIGGLGAGCGSAPAGDPVDGATVFAQMCATCHGPDGRPPASMIARIGVRDLTEAEFRARVTPALVDHQVRTGSRSKLMPAFQGLLSDAQIEAVAAFVASPRFAAPK
jgi:mono/diheme cytochrome c family protein